MENETVNEFFGNQQQDDSIRPEIVQTAISFLQNKNVINTPLTQKQKFLQRKGLSSKEIQMACQKSGAYALHESQQQPQTMPQLPMSLQQTRFPMQQQLTVFQQLKDIFHTATVFSFVAYALYKLYDKFIRPFLFGPKKSIDDKVEDLERNVTTSVNKLTQDVLSMKTEVEKISNNSNSSTQRMLQNLQTEVSTVKGLLLSRKQFPSTVNNPVVPPSIPAWQMSSVAGEPEVDHDPKSEDLIEVGSGDGSEPDNRTKTSDSSLEIMSEFS